MLADSETSVPTSSTDPFSQANSSRMNQTDTQHPAPPHRIMAFFDVPWPETAHERFHAAESILSHPYCNLSPIGERAWRKYRTAVEGWIQSWEPRYWAYRFDPGHAEDFFQVNPEQMNYLQRRCYYIIAEHDRHRVRGTAFIQNLTNEQYGIMTNVLCLYRNLYYSRYGTAVKEAYKQAGESFRTRSLPDRELFIDLQKKLEAEAEHFRQILEGEIPDDHQGSPTTALLHTVAGACGIDSMEMQEMICRYAIHGKLKDGDLQEYLKNGDSSIHVFDPPRDYASRLVKKAQKIKTRSHPKRNCCNSSPAPAWYKAPTYEAVYDQGPAYRSCPRKAKHRIRTRRYPRKRSSEYQKYILSA